MLSAEGKTTKALSHSEAIENEQDLYKLNVIKIPSPGSVLLTYYTVKSHGREGLEVGWEGW